MAKKILLGLTILLMASGAAWAYPVSGTPTLLVSSGGEGPRTITPYGTTTDRVLLHGTTYNTDTPMSYIASGYGYSQESYANPLGFQVNTRIAAWNGVNYATADGVVTWFVLKGGLPGSIVSLTVDIGFQGQVSALSSVSPSVAAAYFTNYLSFVSSTSSDQYNYLIVQNGVVNLLGPPGWTLAGTVPDLYYAPGTYEINEVIRSKPFDVVVGTPFRLALVLNATIATGGVLTNTAVVDWDPGFCSYFIPGGFALADGTPLIGTEYSIQAVNIPIPAAFLLLGSGLLSLGALGLRGRRKA